MKRPTTAAARLPERMGLREPLGERIVAEAAVQRNPKLVRSFLQAPAIAYIMECRATIKELAETIMDVVECKREIKFDTTKPGGTPRKRSSVDRLHALRWQHQIPLRGGIEGVYGNFLKTYANGETL